MVEIWQADADGATAPADSTGSARSGTDDDGRFEFVTVKPGRVPWPEGGLQAPHLAVRRVRARAAQARRDAALLPGRAPPRTPSRPRARRASPPSGARHARRGARRRRAALRHPLAGPVADDILRGVTTFDALFVPGRAPRGRLGSRVARGDARGRAGACAAGALRGRRPRGGRRARSPRPATSRTPYDWRRCSRAGPAVGNPVEPLVRALRDRVGEEHERYVHFGATSQDILDTAAMLVARRAPRASSSPTSTRRRSARAPASRARTVTRRWPLGRCSSRQCRRPSASRRRAGSLRLLDAGTRLRRARAHRSRGAARRRGRDAGGARERGARVVDALRAASSTCRSRRSRGIRTAFASPSSAQRSRSVAGVCGKIGLDVELLAQTEVGEVREGVGGRLLDDAAEAEPGARDAGAGVRPVLGAPRMRPCSSGALVQEHQRAAGAWHAEWEALCGALAFAGGAADAASGVALAALEVDAERMRANLDADDGRDRRRARRPRARRERSAAVRPKSSSRQPPPRLASATRSRPTPARP